MLGKNLMGEVEWRYKFKKKMEHFKILSVH